MLRALTTLALIAMPGMTMAAGLQSDAPRVDIADPGSPAEWGRFYAEVYGGFRAPGPTSFTDDEPTETFPLSNGPAFGAAAGISTGIKGLSFGVDLMHTHSTFEQFPLFDMDTLSIMATAELAYQLDDRFTIYGSGGLGATNVIFANHDPDEHEEEPYTAWAPSYEVALGGRVALTQNLAFFTEVKHQDLLAPATLSLDEGPTDVGVGHNSLLAGIRFSY